MPRVPISAPDWIEDLVEDLEPCSTCGGQDFVITEGIGRVVAYIGIDPNGLLADKKIEGEPRHGSLTVYCHDCKTAVES